MGYRFLISAALVAIAACVALLLPLKAFAYGTVPAQQGWTVNGCNGQCVGFGTSALMACQDIAPKYIAWYNSVSGGFTSSITGPISVCGAPVQVKYPNGVDIAYTGFDSFGTPVAGGTACPADSTLLNGSCICDSGFQPSSGQCVPTNCQAVAQALRDANLYLEWNGTGSSICWQGCTVSFSIRGYLSSTGKSSAESGTATADSSSCLGGSNAGSTGTDPGVGQPSGRCPAKQCPGTVNGQPVCVPCTSESSKPKTTTTTGGSPVEGGPPGSTSSKSETTCSGDECVTTKKFFDSQGQEVGSATTTESRESFCSENPGLAFCRNSSWGGTCGAFSCDGDAIQCALAREVHNRNCQFIDGTGQDGTLAAAGAAAVAGGASAPAVSQSLQFSSVIDQTDRLAGTCPGDIQAGGFTIGLSQMCGPLQTLGNLLVGLTMFAALFIVFRQ